MLAADSRSADLERVADEQLRLVWAHARLGSIVATAFAVLLALKLRGEVVPAPWADGWLAVKVAIGAGRTVAAWRFARDEPGGARARAWADIWLAVDGAVWGLAGFAVMVNGAVPVASLIGAVLVGISCAATFGLQVCARSTAAYVVPIVAPTALGLLLRGDEFGRIGGLGLLLLLALQIATARRSERRLVDGMLLRLQAQALVREKDEALQLALRQSAVKTQFLANISHELRTPLHGILGLARVLLHEIDVRPQVRAAPGPPPEGVQETWGCGWTFDRPEDGRTPAAGQQPPAAGGPAFPGDPALRQRVVLIEASGTHLLALINDLLDISRVEAGRFVMRAVPFDLAAQVAQVAAVHALRAREKGLAFDCTTQLPERCWVSGDAARFRQVLHNLLGNAVKFTEHGSVALAVVAEAASENSALVSAEVRDSGPGIGEADLAQIFEAFRQSASTAAQTADGAGLGLTIARDIAREMGGDIVVDSHVGVGSVMRFTARLPLAAAPPAATTAPALPAARTSAAANGLSVLVAEDDDVNALIVLAYLEHLGAVAERVGDGAAALPRVLRESGRPDLVLMDCRMPVLDGYAATRAIRDGERVNGWPRLPVIALTATAGDADRQQCLDAGMDDFLVKPYTRDELATLLARWAPRG